MADKQFKVLKLKIIKPVKMDWKELGQSLRDTRYRVYRLANLNVSEKYLAFHLWRTGKTDVLPREKTSDLNKRLREMLLEEYKKKPDYDATKTAEGLNKFSKTGALPDTVAGALFMYRIKGLTSGEKWKQVINGKSALPTFRRNMAIPIRCDKPYQRRLERTGKGEVVLDLMIRNKPYPRVLLGTQGIGESAEAIIERLLANPSQALEGYRQRYFDVKEDENKKCWFLYVCYTFRAPAPRELDPSRIVGVDVGYSCPVFAAISNGHARLGHKAFSSLAARVKALQRRTIRRRKDIQRGGNVATSGETARSGHGRKRKLLGIEKLQGKINDAYTTLNHQMSAAVIKFALDNGAGTIQLENLEGLREELSGTFLGQMWRYFQLQQFLQYKAEENGIVIRKVNPRYTSRRCSQCGHINKDFTRAARDRKAEGGYAARFECPKCQYKADADYNAARNLAVDGIEGIMKKQCGIQGIAL